MGASQSRMEDATLQLAIPKHITLGPRRVLDPSTKACSVCKTGFGVLGTSVFGVKKHYCRRCGCIVCERCTTMRRYKKRMGGAAFRVCERCNAPNSLFDRVPIAVWHLIVSFVPTATLNPVLQTARKMQVAVPLPFPMGSGWSSFFAEHSFISKGANGSVYKTSMKRSQGAVPVSKEEATQAVAVKVIQKSAVYSQRKWNHVLREISALQICRHRHVIEYIGSFQSPEAVFLVLQYANGGDLFDWLMTRKAPSELEIVPIASQLLQVLHYMHAICNAVHRDIKPENILLEKRVRGSETPVIRVADFGFARVFGRPQGATAAPASLAGNSLAAPGTSLQPINHLEDPNANAPMVAATPCGTLGFAAPEILAAYAAHKDKVRVREGGDVTTGGTNSPPRGASPPTSPTGKNGPGGLPSGGGAVGSNSSMPLTPIELMKKMDIFAAGVTLCILLTGCEPFPCNNSRAHLEAVRRGVNFSRSHWGHVSKAAKELISRMVHPNAAMRPTAEECLKSPWLAGRWPMAAMPSAPGIATMTKSTDTPITILGDSNTTTSNNNTMTASRNPSTGGNNNNSFTTSSANTASAATTTPAMLAVPKLSKADQEEVARSFQASVKALRKNDGTVLVSDKHGHVVRKSRVDVVDKADDGEEEGSGDEEGAGSLDKPLDVGPLSSENDDHTGAAASGHAATSELSNDDGFDGENDHSFAEVIE